MSILDRNKIAVRLRELREEAGKSQQDIADILGISRPAYTFYETGKRAPTSENLFVLADFFHVTTDYLLGRTDERKVYITENPPELADIEVTEVGQSAPFTEEQLVALKEIFADMQKGQ